MEHEASLVAQLVQNLLVMWEAQVQLLGQEDPLEKGNPLQYSCLKNYMDRRAWWATVHWVTELDTTEQLSTTQKL